MKEATGELSMTVVTIVAIVAVLAIVTYFLAPAAKTFIEEKCQKIIEHQNHIFS